MDLRQAIKERRSIRKYKPTPVPDQAILECVEAARFAPSWANTQVSRFVVVKDQKTKEALAEALGSGNPARQAMIEAPCAVCLVAQRGMSGMKRGEPVTDKGDYWFMFDSGIAMEHFVLTAWSLGLGTVHIGAFDARRAEAVLGVPQGYSAVAMTPLGYFDAAPSPTPRKPIEELLFLDKFGKAYT